MGGKATGAVRVSLGMASNFFDIHRFLKFITGTYLN
jgi:selenocysteine lyase/cysteine desulfurase